MIPSFIKIGPPTATAGQMVEHERHRAACLRLAHADAASRSWPTRMAGSNTPIPT